jgi:hypothetical protein
MLTIHIGMPKTGTTACQRTLSAAAPALARMGFEYPSGFRNTEGIAHHAIAGELVSRRDLKGPEIEGFLAYLAGNSAGNVIISSEAFTNALGPSNLATFLEFIDACRARTLTRLVISLRRIDSFMESMYLHSVKVGETRIDLADYVAARWLWTMSLFRGLAIVRTRVGTAEMVVIKYEATEAFVGRFFDAIGLPFRHEPEFFSVPRENIRLGLKAHTILRHLDHFTDLIATPADRRELVRGFEKGDLQFEQDAYSYRLLSFEDADRFHSQGIEGSRQTGVREYEEFFGAERVTACNHTTLDPSNVNASDLLKLKAFLQQH